eukprot:s1321_g7.t3
MKQLTHPKEVEHPSLQRSLTVVPSFDRLGPCLICSAEVDKTCRSFMELKAVLLSVWNLPESEQRQLLVELLEKFSFSASLEAWCDQDHVPEYTSPRPRFKSNCTGVCLQGQGSDSVLGCPWCRRPLTISVEIPQPLPCTVTATTRHAYATLLYGGECDKYFLGALVVAEGLRRFATESRTGQTSSLLLLHTYDVPKAYIEALTTAGWKCKEVDYIYKGVARALFKNYWTSRFHGVFTKLRALEQHEYEKVLFLDLDILVRGDLADVFRLRAPAAMKRGEPVMEHGELVPYATLWGHPTRREADRLPQHQQASGINAGVMLLKPDQAVFETMRAEIFDFEHPEHYETYMPEQEYLSRFYGTFDNWTHISCQYNFEIDKNERIPHDFSGAHENIRNGAGHRGAVVLHYSGTSIKPWDLLYSEAKLRVDSFEDVARLHRQLRLEGPGDRLNGYKDADRLWRAMLEWLEQFEALVTRLASDGVDVVDIVKVQVEMAEAQARKRAAEQGESEQCQNGYGNWGCGDRWQTPVHYDASEGDVEVARAASVAEKKRKKKKDESQPPPPPAPAEEAPAQQPPAPAQPQPPSQQLPQPPAQQLPQPPGQQPQPPAQRLTPSPKEVKSDEPWMDVRGGSLEEVKAELVKARGQEQLQHRLNRMQGRHENLPGHIDEVDHGEVKHVDMEQDACAHQHILYLEMKVILRECCTGHPRSASDALRRSFAWPFLQLLSRRTPMLIGEPNIGQPTERCFQHAYWGYKGVTLFGRDKGGLSTSSCRLAVDRVAAGFSTAGVSAWSQASRTSRESASNWRMLLIERRPPARRALVNSKQVISLLRSGLLRRRAAAFWADFAHEDLKSDVRGQWQLASSASILIGAHGAGLAWGAFMSVDPSTPPPPPPPPPEERERRPSNGKGTKSERLERQAAEKPSAESTRLWFLLQEKKGKAVADWLSHADGQKEVNIKDRAFGWTPVHFAAHLGSSNTPLMCAARQNNTSATNYLIAKKANLNSVNNNGWTALIWCAINGCEDVATALLTSSANYLKSDNEGRTACMWAARHGHLSMVETLLANGLNLLQADEAGLTVYDHAQEQLEMRSMIAAVQEVNEELQAAARNNDYDGVKRAIEEGANLNVEDEDGWTPLMWAALHQSLDMVQLVIRHGANPNLIDERGEVLQMLSTDHLAVGDSVVEIVGSNERLLEHAKAGRWQEIDAELAIGAWVNVRDEARRTALLWAARHGACEAVTNLVNKNADLDARDESGWLPVHWAAQSGNVQTLCNLHYLGSDFTSRTYVGETALHIAAQYNDGAMIQALLASNADIEELDVDMRTALHMAAANGQTIALQTLLFYKADPDKVVEDDSGATAFLLAVINHREAVVQAMPLSVRPASPEKAKKTKNLQPERERDATKGSTSVRGSPGGARGNVKSSAKAVATPTPKNKVGSRKKLVKDLREKRGEHPCALLETATDIRSKLVKSNFPSITRKVLKQTDCEQRSALALAVLNRSSNIIQILIGAKADLETVDAQNNGILHYAAMNRDREVVALLMELNARIDRENTDGMKPSDLCEDADILHMIARKLVSKKLASLPPAPPTTHPALDGGNLLEESARKHRIRFEGLQVSLSQENITEQLKLFIKQRGAPKANRIEVALDPITARPKGHAYADFSDMSSADLVGSVIIELMPHMQILHQQLCRVQPGETMAWDATPMYAYGGLSTLFGLHHACLIGLDGSRLLYVLKVPYELLPAVSEQLRKRTANFSASYQVLLGLGAGRLVVIRRLGEPHSLEPHPAHCAGMLGDTVWTNLRALVKRSATLLRDILPVALGSLVSVHCLLKQDAPQSRPGDAAEVPQEAMGVTLGPRLPAMNAQNPQP